MLSLEVELMVAVAGTVDAQFVEGENHLLPAFDISEGWGGEAVPWK